MAKAKQAPAAKPDNVMRVTKRKEDERDTLAVARAIISPDFRHAVTTSQVLKSAFGSMAGAPGLGDYADAIGDQSDQAAKGELGFVSRMLAAQAVTLDNVFTELARRMALNMGEHLNATDIYARHAMKAQAQSRATLEALVKIHQPHEQTVRHVHVGQGGQAVVADQFHHHAGGSENANAAEQCHTTGSPGASPALPGPNPLGDTVPIAGRVGEAALPHARRQ